MIQAILTHPLEIYKEERVVKDLIEIQQQLIPDLVEKMYRRFSILATISQNEPVGRRSLSEHMDLTERVLRSETDLLKTRTNQS